MTFVYDGIALRAKVDAEEKAISMKGKLMSIRSTIMYIRNQYFDDIGRDTLLYGEKKDNFEETKRVIRNPVN